MISIVRNRVFTVLIFIFSFSGNVLSQKSINIVLQVNGNIPEEATVFNLRIEGKSIDLHGKYIPGMMLLDEKEFSALDSSEEKVILSFSYISDQLDIGSRAFYSIPISVNHLRQRYVILEISNHKRKRHAQLYDYKLMSPLGATISKM